MPQKDTWVTWEEQLYVHAGYHQIHKRRGQTWDMMTCRFVDRAYQETYTQGLCGVFYGKTGKEGDYPIGITNRKALYRGGDGAVSLALLAYLRPWDLLTGIAGEEESLAMSEVEEAGQRRLLVKLTAKHDQSRYCFWFDQLTAAVVKVEIRIGTLVAKQITTRYENDDCSRQLLGWKTVNWKARSYRQELWTAY